MGLEVQSICVYLKDIANLGDLTFSGPINQNYAYGITGFSLSYPNNDGHNVLDLQVSATMTATSSNSLKPTIVAMMDDNGNNTPDPNSSWVYLTVVAYTGNNAGVVTMGNTGLVTSGTAEPITLAGGTVTSNTPLLGGFKLQYPDGDHQVMAVSGSTSADTRGNVTPSAAMSDNNNKHNADAQADGGYLYAFKSSPGFLVHRRNGLQSGSNVSEEFGQPLAGCAVLMAGFKVHYESNNAHDINTIRVGVTGGTVSLDSSKSNVIIPAPQALMWDDGHPTNHTQDNSQSSVDLIIIGIPQGS